METLEIHSKSFLIKWITANEGSVITWQITPNKKSINFGLYRKLDSTIAPVTSGSSTSKENDQPRDRSNSQASLGSIEERLDRNGLSKVKWHGRCEPDVDLRGRYEISSGCGGVYALVFDNTFSKTISKQVLFSCRVEKKGKDEDFSFINTTIQDDQTNQPQVVPPQQKSTSGNSAASTCVSDGRYLRGVMLKKRRKRLQGFARRYFSLDYKLGMLNYYLDQRTSLLRGSMPINLSVVSAREASREIFIDSGMEVWNLKALNAADFKTWVQAFEITRNVGGGQDSGTVANSPIRTSLIQQPPKSNDSEEWNTIRDLVSRLESVKQLANQSQSANRSQVSLTPSSPPLSAPPIPDSPNPDDPQQQQQQPKLQRRPSFWRRRKSSKEAKSPNLNSSSSSKSPNPNTGSFFNNSNGSSTSLLSGDTSPKLKQIGERLDDILSEFHALISTHDNKLKDSQVAVSPSVPVTARPSLDGGESVWSEEFFDAAEAFDGVVYVEGEAETSDNELETVGEEEEGEGGVDENDSDDDDEDNHMLMQDVSSTKAIAVHDLYPLPHGPVSRRNTVNNDNGPPPSLISILRKNVGKDMTSIPMPVTMNEPITALQRLGEFMEYSNLIDAAVHAENPVQRAMFVAAFAATYASGFRARQRCSRKPFNPLLGETYELVREDKGYRVICEKVSHRPPILAMQVESKEWTMNYSARPNQKFWGKTIEFNDSGPVRITVNKTGESFEYIQPSMFMRNMIAGEKYLEPTGHCTVYSTTGAKAVVEYKAGGMFAGRSEDLTIRGYDSSGSQVSQTFYGKWTEKFIDSSSKATIWQCGQLVKDFGNKYGFTEWVSTLNEITDIEKDNIPPTDSRLRPDQRYYEQGIVDQAEESKQQLEQDQRVRRGEMEKAKQRHEPAFFVNNGKDFYVLKSGDDNYWTRRQKGDWNGLVKLW